MADVKVDISVNSPRVSRFTVSAKTLKDAVKALDARDEWGLYDATRNPRQDAKADKDGRVVSVTIVLNPVIELPQWSGYSSATKEQKDSWDKMVKALEAHERKHHDIQVKCAAELKKQITNARSLDGKSLNKLIDDQQKACQKKQDDYDSSSGHGDKEGVTLDVDA